MNFYIFTSDLTFKRFHKKISGTFSIRCWWFVVVFSYKLAGNRSRDQLITSLTLLQFTRDFWRRWSRFITSSNLQQVNEIATQTTESCIFFQKSVYWILWAILISVTICLPSGALFQIQTIRDTFVPHHWPSSRIDLLASDVSACRAPDVGSRVPLDEELFKIKIVLFTNIYRKIWEF